MSASITPTSAPPAARDAARLAVSDDLPTPPLPDATAITDAFGGSVIGFLPPAAGASPPPAPCSRVRSAVRSAGVITSNVTPTLSTPATAPTRSCTWCSRSAFMGQPATVSAIVTSTCAPRDVHAPHHVELDHAAADLGVDHPNQRLANLILGNH